MTRPISPNSLQRKRLSVGQPARWLGPQMLLGGFVIGTGAGIGINLLAPDEPWTTDLLIWFVRPLEQVFLTILFILIVPLLFAAVVSGVARLRGSAGTPGLLATTLAYMIAVSASGALIGLAMTNLFRPGDGIPPEIGQQILATHEPPIPTGLMAFTPDYSSINGAMLVMIILSFAIGMALPLLRRRNRQWLLKSCERLFDIGMKILAIVTWFAPLAVACFMFDMTVMFGWQLLVYLATYVIVVVAALALQIVLTFFIVVWMRGDLAPTKFLRGVQEAALIAFSTSSSNATLPTALKVAENELNLPGRIVRPVLSLGTVGNQSGTSIYVAVTVLFIGQFFGTDLSFDKQALVFLIAVLAGMGTIGVPAGALPIVATLLSLTGLPPAGIGLVIGIDRLLDMFRTLVNVVGDLAISVAIAREPIAAHRDKTLVSHDIGREPYSDGAR